jgi:hypothetical protein
MVIFYGIVMWVYILVSLQFIYMATKTTPASETPATKAIRDATTLAKESSGDVDDPVGDLNKEMVKSIARQMALEQAQVARTTLKADKIEAENRLETVRKTTTPQLPQMPSLGGVLGGGLGQIANPSANVAAILEKLPEEDRKTWLDENKSLVFGGIPSLSALSALSGPQKPVKTGSDGDLLTGVAALIATTSDSRQKDQLLALEQQKYYQTLLQQTQTQAQALAKPSNGGNDEVMKTIVAAVTKLAEVVSKGQSDMELRLQQIQSQAKDAQHERETKMQERLFEMQKEIMAKQSEVLTTRSEAEKNIIVGELQRMREAAQQSSGVQHELANLRATLASAKELGMGITTETPDQEKNRRMMELEMRKLERDEKMMEMRHQEELSRNEGFKAKIGVIGDISSLLMAQHESMKLKKAVQGGGGSQAAKNLVGRF